MRVLVAAADLSAEPTLVAALQPEPDLTIAGRCVDATLLVAQAKACEAEAVFLSDGLPNLRPGVIADARDAGLRVLGICEQPVRPQCAIDLDWIDISSGFEVLLQRLRLADDEHRAGVWQLPSERARTGTLISVWGPSGAPGRTTVAMALAAECAAAGSTMLVDADPFGGSIAVDLGITDDVSGVAIACTQALRGVLDADGMARIPRAIARNLALVSGIHSPRRWPELTVIDQVWPVCTQLAETVIVDVGFCLEDADDIGRRTQSTLLTLARSDVVVAVMAAEPAGVLRFLTALPTLREVASQAEIVVVANKVRSGVMGERSVAEACAAAAIERLSAVPFDDHGCAQARARGALLPTKSAVRSSLRGLAQSLTRV